MVYLSTLTNIASCSWVNLMRHFLNILVKKIKWGYLLLFFLFFIGFNHLMNDSHNFFLYQVFFAV